MKKAKKTGWVIALAAQSAETLVLTAALTLGAIYAGAGALYGAAMWCVLPLFGGWSAYKAVRRGLNNYAAWIAPPVCMTAGHYLAAFYPPPGGAMLLTALCAVIGAATGYEADRRAEK